MVNSANSPARLTKQRQADTSSKGSGRRAHPANLAAGPAAISIGALSRATHIPVETIRTWERRYGAPQAIRKPSGHRLYPAECVVQLRHVSHLLSHGHRAGEVVGLSLSELEAMLALSNAAPPEAAQQLDPSAIRGVAMDRTIETLIRAATELDRDTLMRSLREGWSRLGPLRCLEDCAGPFMAAIGAAWHQGTLDIRHEHFASACLSDFLREVREPYAQQARGPSIAAAALPGDTHEGGLLMSCALMAVRGYRVLYLGVGIPVDQVAASVHGGKAERVAISVSAAMPSARAAHFLTLLRGSLPRRTPLWIGGAGAPPHVKGVVRFDTLAAFDAHLASGA